MAEEEANRKRRPTTQDTGSIAFEESSSIGNEEQQVPSLQSVVYGSITRARAVRIRRCEGLPMAEVLQLRDVLGAEP